MSTKILRVAIAGCGEVAQVIHLPTLAQMSHLYKVTALFDVSNDALNHCRKKWGIEKGYNDYYEMIRSANVDVVFILTADEYHTPYAVAAADVGKAVFIEKPMCLTNSDADEIVEAEKRNQVHLFIGYMRRYAEAFETFKTLVSELKSIDYVRVRDIIGDNDFFVQQSGAYPIKPSDIPSAANEDRKSRGRKIAETAIPSRADSPRDVSTYRLLGSLGSHDLSAMRELLGSPKSCIAATRNRNFDESPFLTCLFEFEQGFTAVYETGIDRVRKFDCSIEVVGDGKRLRLDYDTPYVKGLAITINVLESTSSGHFVEKTIRPTYTDAYTLELEQLYKVVVEGQPCKTGPEDARKDLEIFDMVMNALRN